MENQTLQDLVAKTFQDEFQKFTRQLVEHINKKLAEVPKDFIPAIERSPQQNELATALAKAQGEFDYAQINKINSHFKNKYADLLSLIKAVREPLSKNGLSITQEEITNEDEQTYVITTLSHSSGQYRQSKARLITTKAGHQELGSAMTYLRRRTLSTLLGIVGAEDDDDAEAAEAQYRETKERGTALSIDEEQRSKSYERINKTELDELNYTLENYPDMIKDIKDKYGLFTLADLPKERYRMVIDRARQIIKQREKN